MTTTQIILVVAVIAGIAAALLAAQRSGPRVTTIEHTTKRADGEEEDGS